MLELTKEQMEAIQKAISKKAEESVQEFDKELDVVVSKLSTEGWTLPAELNIYAVKTIANTNKLDDINAFLKWFFTTEDFQKTKDMVNGIKASPIKEGLKNLTDQCWQAFQNIFPFPVLLWGANSISFLPVRYRAVRVSVFNSSFGVPAKTIFPPSRPARGPKSTI